MPKVLIVDDSHTIRQQVNFTLTKDKLFEVIMAESAEDCFVKLKENPDISLIFSDINMPGMNGLDMVEKIKADSQYSSIKVVMLTTEGNEQKIQRAKNAGANGWIVKPFVPEQLIDMAKKLA